MNEREIKWSGKDPIPAIGSRVKARHNPKLPAGEVVGYFFDASNKDESDPECVYWLGVVVKLDQAWSSRPGGTIFTEAKLYGAEIKMNEPGKIIHRPAQPMTAQEIIEREG